METYCTYKYLPSFLPCHLEIKYKRYTRKEGERKRGRKEGKMKEKGEGDGVKGRGTKREKEIKSGSL